MRAERTARLTRSRTDSWSAWRWRGAARRGRAARGARRARAARRRPRRSRAEPRAARPPSARAPSTCRAAHTRPFLPRISTRQKDRLTLLTQ